MEEEISEDIIKATQLSLGKFVKRPPLTEKLLRKPPFRFLHDIVTAVMKNTGFFEGLFAEQELISDNVKDRESKIIFLNKVITVLSATTGNCLTAKPSKIVAGQEPTKTNELLQCLGQALEKKLSSDDAVKKYKESSKSPIDKVNKDTVKGTKKKPDVKKITEKVKDTHKITANRNEKTNSKLLLKDSTKKADSPPKKVPSSTNLKKNVTNNQQTVNKSKIIENKKQENTVNIVKNDELKDDTKVLQKQDSNNDNNETVKEINEQPADNNDGKREEKKFDNNEKSAELENIDNKSTLPQGENTNNFELQKHTDERVNEVLETLKVESEKLVYSEIKADNHNVAIEKNNDTKSKSTTESNNTNMIEKRPQSVRPSSSRPGAPRVKDKHNTVLNQETPILHKVNIITEHAVPEEEEDGSIVIVDNTTFSMLQNEEVHLSSEQHGHLVQQILESQKEFSQVSGKTEIEWQFGVQKARDVVNQEVEQMRFNVQALSRISNPLGKLIDHIQEDVEVMRQELLEWTRKYEESSEELSKQKVANIEFLQPLQVKLKQLDADVEDKRDKINDLRIVVFKNYYRIEKLLGSRIVQ